jgi:prepilin-type N-terminal cleavage/methylation domain-containing protein
MNTVPRPPASVALASGFTLVEFLMAVTLLLIVSLSLFRAVNEIQQSACRQAEVQEILDNMRMAFQAVAQCIRQAGNDPYRTGFEAVSIVGPTAVQIRSDLTGSEAPGKPNRGDPDGDTSDFGEDVLIRYNNLKKRIEMVSGKSPARIIADRISGFSLEYLDAEGNPIGNGADVVAIRVKMSGTAAVNPSMTGNRFGLQWVGTVRILSKK